MNKPLDYIFPNPPADLDPSQLDAAAVPQHVAVIMDGNGRWAKERGKNRLFGHKAGIEAVRETIRCASDVGVRYLTIYSFSSENWKRPQDEVIGLMNLFATTMLAEVDGLHEEHVRVMTIGRTDELPKKTRDAFAKAWETTKDNEALFAAMKDALGDSVMKVAVSSRLTDAPACITAAGPVSLEMERIMAQMPDGGEGIKSERVLEVNAKHAVFDVLRAAQEAGDADKVKLYAELLYNQALLVEGLPIEDPVAYANAVTKLMA